MLGTTSQAFGNQVPGVALPAGENTKHFNPRSTPKHAWRTIIHTTSPSHLQPLVPVINTYPHLISLNALVDTIAAWFPLRSLARSCPSNPNFRQPVVPLPGGRPTVKTQREPRLSRECATSAHELSSDDRDDRSARVRCRDEETTIAVVSLFRLQ